MIRLQNLTLQRGPQRLLEDAELTLHAGHKAGLVGANGAGKSTLFALLLGELTPDSGDCLLPADWRIAHMRQEIDTLDRIAIDYVLDGDQRLRQVQADLARAEADEDGAAQARLHSELDSADGYTADARARKMLAGLGFTNEQIRDIQDVYRFIYQSGMNTTHSVEPVQAELAATNERDEILQFIKNSPRGIIKGYFD